ncbi:mucoidy inhibitor MuiA family protein [bacterium]|nr:mucoidy inhibitor MuiA family protein [bacterium]
MKHLVLFLIAFPFLIFGNDEKTPSKIKEVTVYLSGANITRTAECSLVEGASEITLTGLSTKIDENSIQISGLQSVSILSMSYDINFMPIISDKTTSKPLEERLDAIESEIALLKNKRSGLEEEEQVIYANRIISGRSQSLSLEKLKEISTYYRERITAIKNEIFRTNLKVKELNMGTKAIQKQMAELNNSPEKEQGEIKIKFDAPIATTLQLEISYQVHDAGWIPNYDIKSKNVNMPLSLAYKAHVYQKTGNDWDNVNIILSTGNPSVKIAKPNLGTKYLNFTNGYRNTTSGAAKKQKYIYNPTVKMVTGTVVDESGLPLPGANILVKGTSNGTQTDFDGYFSLNVQNGQELEISYVGTHSKVIPIYTSVMNISLDEDASQLNEVVVVGYGSQTRGDYTGSVSSVLAGKASGVQIESSPDIKIRGISAVKSNSVPLYIIDGTPISSNDVLDIDPDMIASMNILKGKEASIYGSRGSNGVVVITTKKSTVQDDITTTKFVIKRPYSITSDGDITAIEINTFNLAATYEYLAAPIVNENVFLTSTFKDWEQYNLLPGEASVYFKGTYAGKTTIDPYTTKKEMTVSLGIDQNITVSRKQNKDFKSKSFTGSNRIIDRTYDLEVKNNKAIAINLKLMDRIPISQNKDIKVDDIETYSANYEAKKGLLSWSLKLAPQESKTESFSFQVKYPKYKRITL